MTIGAKIVALVLLFLAGLASGVKIHAGIIAQRDLHEQQQAARERIRQQELAAPKAAEHAAAVDALNSQLLDAYAEIANLSSRACLDGRTVRVLNATGNLPVRSPAAQPADPGPAAQAAGSDTAGLRWASNIDVGQYIAYCRTQYGKVADQLNQVLDIEDQRFPSTARKP